MHSQLVNCFWRAAAVAPAALAIAAWLASNSWTATAAGDPPPAESAAPSAAKPLEADPRRTALRDLLLAGMPEAGSFDAKLFNQRRDTARALGPNDPNVDLCYGLGLLHQGKGKSANGLQALDAARQAKGEVVPAAHRLFILYQLSLRDYRKAASALDEFARATTDERLPPDEKAEAARWIGRVVGFYLHPGAKLSSGELIRRQQGAIASRFSPALQKAYAAGIAATAEKLELLQKGASADAEVLNDAASLQRDAAMEKVFQGKDAVILERGKVELTGAQLEQWYKTTVEKVVKEITPLASEYQKGQAVWQELDILRKRRGLGQIVGMSSDRILENLAICEGRLADLEDQIKGWIAVGQRIDLIYAQTKGQVARRSAALGDYEEKLGKIKKNISKDERPQERAARNQSDRLDDLSTYVPLDLRQERSLLLRRLAAGDTE